MNSLLCRKLRPQMGICCCSTSAPRLLRACSVPAPRLVPPRLVPLGLSGPLLLLALHAPTTMSANQPPMTLNLQPLARRNARSG